MDRPNPISLGLTDLDAHAEADRLRASGPAALVELPGGVVAWSVTRYDVIKRLLTDPRISKNPRRSWPAWIEGRIPSDWPLISFVAAPTMLTTDGAEHARLRRLVSKAFTSRRIEEMRPRIEAIVADLIADLAACPSDEVIDLRARFAYPLPLRLICDLFGVPDPDRPEIQRIVRAVVSTVATPEEAAANDAAMFAAIQALVETKRATPGEDMTSALIAAHDQDGTRLSADELISTLVVMIGGGFETTVNLIGSMVVELLTHPDQLTLVRTGAMPWAEAVEETLRLQGPVMHMPLRYATADIDLGDNVLIRAGEPVLIGFAAAGRDPALHSETADTFDITRADKTHLAFGHGVHYCLGAPLARLEAAIALPALFDHFPDLALAVPADQLAPHSSFVINGHQTLPVYLRQSPNTTTVRN